MRNVYWSRCVSLCPSPHSYYCTDPDVTWANGRGCPLVVHHWEDLQSVHGFRCYDNSAEREMSASACTRSVPVYVHVHKCCTRVCLCYVYC